MKKFERILLIIGFSFFGIVPLAGQIPSIIAIAANLPIERAIFITLIVLLGTSVIGIIFGFTFLFTQICTKCVNFSCPFNKVPKELIDAYLDKSPVMKNAWEKKEKNS